MAVWVIELLNYPIDKCAWLHLRAIFNASPMFIWPFGHVLCWKCIWGPLLMTGCIIKHEEPSGKTICFPLKDINCMLNLIKQIIGREPAFLIFSSLKDNMCITKIQIISTSHNQWRDFTLSISSFNLPQSTVWKFDIIIEGPSPLGWGVVLSDLWFHMFLQWSFT